MIVTSDKINVILSLDVIVTFPPFNQSSTHTLWCGLHCAGYSGDTWKVRPGWTDEWREATLRMKTRGELEGGSFVQELLQRLVYPGCY